MLIFHIKPLQRNTSRHISLRSQAFIKRYNFWVLCNTLNAGLIIYGQLFYLLGQKVFHDEGFNFRKKHKETKGLSFL